MKQLWSFALALAAGAAVASPAPAQCQSLTTLFAQNNGGSAGGQVFFDLVVLNPAGIHVASLDTNTSAAIGSTISLDVYTVPTGYAGNQTNQAAWTFVANGSGSSAGVNQPTAIDVADFTLAPGSYGVALIISGGAHSYTGTGATPPTLTFSNADVMLKEGAALNVPWFGAPFQARCWNGTVHYNCANGPVTYCTSGTSVAGCVPAISASSQPSITFAGGCTLSVSNVAGQRNGIVFYGLTGASSISWATGSSSFQCVKPPTQRTGVRFTGGTLGQCDGTLTLDWNVWQANWSDALGNPWTVGTQVAVQAWIHDPTAPRNGVTSDAVQIVCQP